MANLIELLRLEMSIWDIALRSSVAFVGLVALIRVAPKRSAGHLSPNDMLIIVVIGNVAASAIAGESSSVGDLLLMVALVLLWGYAFDVLEYRVPAFRRLMRHKQATLIENGRFVRRNMRQEMVTEEELMSVLRKEGVSELSDVDSAYLEADGEISVIKKRS